MKKVFALFCLCFLAFRVSAQTPAPALDPTRYADLREMINLRGFPQVGFPSAPVSVVIYTAFDDPASGTFFRDGYPALVERARAGEIRITLVPLAGRGSILTGRGAARAALCAGEQNQFFPFHDQLFIWQLQDGNAAYAGSRLIDAANQLGLVRSLWDTCMISDRPDAVLTESDAVVESIATFTRTPFVTVNDTPALLDADSLNAAIDYDTVRTDATFEAALSEETPEPDPESTETATLTIEPLAGDQIAPPFEIDLPEGWLFGYDALVLQDLDAVRVIPLAVYAGPVTGGDGVIVLLWGFPNVVSLGAAVEGGVVQNSVTPNLFSDGLRLLRLAVVESTCNIGTDLRRDYSIGGLSAIGTQFAAVGCPSGLPDTRGWFAGLQQFNLNFVFYAYADPITVMDGTGAAELQAILDSIRFAMPEGGITNVPEETETP